MNITGRIDLLKLEKAGIATIKGFRCVVIPVDDNDIFVKADEATLKAKNAYLGINIGERRAPSQFGDTHYAKQSLSKRFREERTELAAERNKVYLGEFKPFEMISPVEAPVMEVAETDDLPF